MIEVCWFQFVRAQVICDCFNADSTGPQRSELKTQDAMTTCESEAGSRLAIRLTETRF